MSNNHLIIGLGGTGGKVIKAFRREMFEEMHNVDSGRSIGGSPKIQVSYLYVDSSSHDLAGSENWRTQGDIGPLIAIGEANQLSIVHSDLQTRLRDPEQFPVTHRYIGDTRLWTDIFAQTNIQQAAGGQMRRLGAALFEPKCQAFVSRVSELCNELSGRSGVEGVAFHVCCGLAGGTGAGSFLHVIAQLRALKEHRDQFPIYLYVLLPERDSSWASNGDRTNYYANGYAALQELNAYLLDDYRDGPNKGGPLFRPFDLTGNSMRFESLTQGGRSRLMDRLQGCFVLSNVNERDLVIGVRNEEIHDLIAQMLFQRIFRIEGTGDKANHDLKRAISLENVAPIDEGSLTDPDQKIRSVRFLTFGLKRLLVPEEEIREHFAASFASQSALQMLYNNWPAETSSAFVDEKRKISFKQDVQQQDKLSVWKLSDTHVTLSKGILSNEIDNRRWRPIDEDWRTIAPHLAMDAWAQGRGEGRDPRLDLLEKALQERWASTFRGIGVERFYETATRDMRLPDRHVAEICEVLENWMFDQWDDGNLSVSDLETFLDDLIEELERRVAAVPGKIQGFKQRLGTLNEDIDANRKRFAKTGVLGRMLGRPGDIFNAQVPLLAEIYEKRTLVQAWTFAERLLRAVVAELREGLRGHVAEFRVGLSGVHEFFVRRMDRTCQPAIAVNIESANVVKFYDPDKVRKFCRSLLEQEQMQRSWAAVLRKRAIDAAREQRQRTSGREPPFAMMEQHFIKTADAVRVFEDVARNNAVQAHDEKTGQGNRLLGVNIVSKLGEHFSADPEKLRTYVRTLVQSARTFMQWKEVEFAGTTGPLSRFVVTLPRCDENSGFRDDLKRHFQNAFGGQMDFIDSGSRLNEICLVAFKYVFPLRYIDPAWYLKERYDHRLAVGPRDRALLEVHIEDHRPELPSLFRPAPGEAGKRLLPTLQIAAALNLFDHTENEATGQAERMLRLQDSDGRPRFYYYPDALLALFERPARPAKEAAELESMIDRLTQEQSEAVERRVAGALAGEKFRVATARQGLKEALLAQLDAVRQNRNNSERDRIYQRIDEACGVAIERIMAVR
jgi:hypothetical protein